MMLLLFKWIGVVALAVFIFISAKGTDRIRALKYIGISIAICSVVLGYFEYQRGDALGLASLSKNEKIEVAIIMSYATFFAGIIKAIFPDKKVDAE